MEKERPSMIAFLGPEGSGKSTQAKLLAKALDVPYISTGDIIRDAAINDPTELGDACRKMLEEHSYLDPKWVAHQRLLDGRRREDDTPEAIQVRMSNFYSGLAKRMSHLKSKKNWEFITIQAGLKSIEEIHGTIKQKLGINS